MYDRLHFKPCIFIFIFFQNVVSYKIYQLNSAEGNEVLPKIRKIILDQRNEELGLVKHQRELIQNLQRQGSQVKPFGRSVFVKRIIPHSYSTGEYEYDSKLKTIFKPMSRFHVSIPVEENESQFISKSEQKPQAVSDKDLIVLVENKQNQQNLMQQLQLYLDIKARAQKRLKKTNKKKFRGLLSAVDKEDLILRSSLAKSVEQLNPLAPIDTAETDSLETLETTEKTTMPEYPMWNYWTYQNGVIQDECPGNLVKVGNMCIGSVGHRRSGDPPEIPSDARRFHTPKKRRSIRAARKRHLYGSRK